MKVAITLILILISTTVHATTWGESEVDDPVFNEEKCSVHKPASYGGYIYNWPSKYDQVFWPLTDQNGIWFCNKSGFTAFIGDFDSLNSEEVERITVYLLNNPPKNNEITTKLNLLENIYELRDKDDAFRNLLLRVLARWYQELGDVNKANKYRKKAYTDILLHLKKSLDEFKRLEYLYLAANYSRQFGDIEMSDKYILELNSLFETDKSEKTKDFAEYLKNIVSDTSLIKEGGVLDPEILK
jgi:hypothetical protein